MSKLITAWLRLFARFFDNIWWPWWSNTHWNSSKEDDLPIADEDIVTGVVSLRRECMRLYEKFSWTGDGIEELFDSILPPPQAYRKSLAGQIVDDCDGFHSVVYHVLSKSGFESYLLTAHTRSVSHCALLCKIDEMWHVCDYFTVYPGFETAAEAIEDYNKNFVEVYQAKGEVFYNALIKYNYNKGKLRSTSLEEIDA